MCTQNYCDGTDRETKMEPKSVYEKTDSETDSGESKNLPNFEIIGKIIGVLILVVILVCIRMCIADLASRLINLLCLGLCSLCCNGSNNERIPREEKANETQLDGNAEENKRFVLVQNY